MPESTPLSSSSTPGPNTPGPSTATGSHPRLVLVDGHNYLWRAFHAIPPRVRADGVQVNALYGFVANLLRRIVLNARASHIALVFDPDGPSFRHQIYPDYKANRAEPPAELTAQLPLIREATDAFGIARLEQPGFEADDLIATYTRHACAAGMKVTIVSSDKDLLQLVDDARGVSVYHPQTKAVLHEAQVIEKFGVPATRIPDVQALTGDAGDGIPGIPKIGPKIAAELVNTFGTLEQVLSRAEEIPQAKRRERLRDGADTARLAMRLVRLCDDAPLPAPLADLAVRAYAPGDVRAFLSRNALEIPGPWA